MKRILFFFIFFAGALTFGVFQFANAQSTPETTTPGLCGGSGWFYYTTCPNYAAANNYITCNSQQKFSGGTWTHGNCYDSDESSGWTFSGGNCVTDNFCVEPTSCSIDYGKTCQVCNNVGSCNYGTISCSETCVGPQENSVISPSPNVYNVTPPTGSMSAIPSAISSGETITLYLQGYDETGILYLSWTDNNGTHWQNCNGGISCAASGPLTLWIPKADYIFVGTIVGVGSIDGKGNTVFVKSNTVTVTDNVAPTGSISISPNPVAPGQNFIVTMTGQDAGGLFSLTWVDNGIAHEISSSQLSCPSGTSINAPCNATWGGIKFSPGVYTIGGVITDIAGNKTNAYASLNVADTIPPWGSMAAWPSQINAGGTVNLYIQGYDNGAVSSLTWTMKNSAGYIVKSGSKICGQPTVPVQSCDLTAYTTISAPDTYFFTGTVTDLAGYTTTFAAGYGGSIKVGSGIAGCAKTQAPLTDTVTLPNGCSVTITHLGKDITDNSDVSYESLKALQFGSPAYVAMSDNPPLSCANDLSFHNTWNPTAVDPYNFYIDSAKDSYSAGNTLEYGYQLSTDTCVIAQNFECSYTSGNTCPMPNIAPNNKSVAVFGRQTNSFDPAQSLKEFAFNFRIVPDVPWIPIFTPQNQWYSANPSVSIMISDTELPLAHAYYTIDSAVATGNPTTIFTDATNVGKTYFPWAGFSISDEAWSNLSEGPHTIYFAAYNSAGFCTGCDGQISFAFNKDTTAPESMIEDFMAKKISINNAPIQPPQSLGSPRPSDNTFWFGEGTWEIPISDTDLGSTFGTGSGIDPNSCSYTIQDLGPNGKMRSGTRTCNKNITITVGPTTVDQARDCQTQGDGQCRLTVKAVDKATNPTTINSVSRRDLNIDYTPPTAQ